MLSTLLTDALVDVPLQASGFIPKGTRVDVFGDIYWTFTILGTLIGTIVIGYMLYNAYKYRDDGSDSEKTGQKTDRPEVGELPTGGGKGRKLFLSFALSAIVVITLIVGTYGSLLYVENVAAGDEATIDEDESFEVLVVGRTFGWDFAYPGGNETIETAGGTVENVTVASDLRVPTNHKVRLNVTSKDVHHNLGIPELRAKTDALPGQYTYTWLEATEPGNTYQAKCYELCGAGHSYMAADAITMTDEEFRSWYNGNSSVNASEAGV